MNKIETLPKEILSSWKVEEGRKIPITKPFLPPQEEYEKYLSGIWERNWLTNMGPLSEELEEKLQGYLKVENLLFVANGTLALQMAIKALELKGGVITTPFSFVATTSSIVWENCKPVFVDIDEKTLNIDPSKIEDAINENTSAILATHVYGNPCDVEAIEKIAKKHNLKVIYDAAHAFGVEINGKSIFDHGDISTCSLHATKLYHSVEGGLVITKDKKLHKSLKSMRNFGFAGPLAFDELGINAKNSEYHAAMGLANLKYIRDIVEKRRELTEHYHKCLKNTSIFVPQWNGKATKNYAYCPVVFETQSQLLACMEEFKTHDIYARRYFYPSLAKVLPYLPKKDMPITDDIAKRVVCLPLYHDLAREEVDLVCELVLKSPK